MARMYSGSKGKAGSKKPLDSDLSWVRYKPKEIELLIVKLSKSGESPSRIGLTLRDTYGVPDVKKITEKSISEILKEKNLLKKVPEDLTSLIKRAVTLRKHLGANKKDEAGKRGLKITESKIKRLEKYYKKTKKLAMEWRYDPEKAELALD